MVYSINHLGRSVIFDTTSIKNNYLRKCADKAIEKLFCHFLPSQSEDVVLTFCFTDSLDKHFREEDNQVMSENAKANSSQIFMSGHGNKFGYEFGQGGRLEKVYYQVYAPSRIDNNMSRAKSRAFLTAVDAQIVNFYTRGYLNSIQQVNISDGGSYMHACSFAIGDEGYIVAATPGAGKSSLLLSLRFAENIGDFKFISDDFSAIDTNGHAHQIGRAMAMKSHQLQYFPQLESVVQNMSKIQKLQWFLLKRQGLKYMLTPEELFGNKITTDVPVKHLIYLTNHGKDTIESEKLSVAEFARLNANMLFSELYLGLEIFNHVLMLPNVNLVGNVADFINNTRQNIEKCLNGCECTLVKVPFRSDPRKVLEYFVENQVISNE